MIRSVATLAAAALLAACGSPKEDASSSTPGKAPTPAERGQKAFRECAVCHVVAAPGTKDADVRLIGPNLYGVIGRRAGSVEGFAYSKAMKEAGFVWDEAALDAYIASPSAKVPGNRMSFVGEPDAAKRADIVAWLKANGPAE